MPAGCVPAVTVSELIFVCIFAVFVRKAKTDMKTKRLAT